MQNIINRIELCFLDYVIIVLSESILARSLVSQGGKFYHQYKDAIRVGAVLLICGMVGLVAGRLFIKIGISMQLH